MGGVTFINKNWESDWYKKTLSIINEDFEFAFNDKDLTCLYRAKNQNGILKDKLFNFKDLYEIVYEFGMDPLQVCISEIKKTQTKYL